MGDGEKKIELSGKDRHVNTVIYDIPMRINTYLKDDNWENIYVFIIKPYNCSEIQDIKQLISLVSKVR